ncbi:hypothetical protein ACFL0X_02990 [Nanoarchaeota archaeon]
MEYKNTLTKVKKVGRDLAVAYAFLGSLCMAGTNVTGHPSADNYLSRNPVAQEEVDFRKTLDSVLGGED